MDNIRKFEPLWGVWNCDCVLGEGSFGRVYRAVRCDGDRAYYSAVKHISVPANEQQLQEVRRSGLYRSDEEISIYFNDVVRDVKKEVDMMYALKANTNIVSYEDHLIIPKETGIGCDIFIRMELLRDLSSLAMEDLSEEEAVNIGIDICTALEVCARSNIIHRDIKPSNIFVNANGDYKLGDFGIAKVLSGTTAGVSKKGTYSYMAPEIYKCEPANFTSDIYSLGVVLYRILNDNRLPFLPRTGIVRPQDYEDAMMKVISGAPMPPPVNASPQMAKVILKACSYNKRDRYRTAGEFRNALFSVLAGSDAASYPAPVDFGNFVTPPAEPSAKQPELMKGQQTEIYEAPAAGKGKKKKTGFIAFAAMAVVIAIVAGIFSIVPKNRTKSGTAPLPEVSAGDLSETPEVPTKHTDDGFSLQILDGYAQIVQYSGSDTDIAIPDEIDGVPVTRIDRTVFYGRSDIKSIEIPDSITYIGNSAFYECSSLESILIPDSVTYIASYAFYGCSGISEIDIPDSVSFIGSGAFGKCSKISEITIPDGIESIGGSTFIECRNLKSISLPDSITKIGEKAFEGCSSLSEISIPEGVTDIGYEAFLNCIALKKVNIPQKITHINRWVFQNCSSLKNITIPDSVTFIDMAAFSGCSALTGIVIPDSVASIDDGAFSDCTNLKSVRLSENLTVISPSTFANCRSLSEIKLPEGITEIGDSAFNGCEVLKKINIPEGVTKLGSSAFSCCSELAEITIPEGVTEIKENTFDCCSSLRSIVIPEAVTYIGRYAFNCCDKLESVTISESLTSIDSHAFHECSGISSLVLPDTVSYIGEGAFEGCSALKSINIPKGVTKINANTFCYCSSLTELTLPEGVTSIDLGAFSFCTNLRKINIPEGLTSIGEVAFMECTSLKSLRIPESVKSIGSFAFENCPITITAPYASYYYGYSIGDNIQWKDE